jgi:hypothetical protein
MSELQGERNLAIGKLFVNGTYSSFVAFSVRMHFICRYGKNPRARMRARAGIDVVRYGRSGTEIPAFA